GPSFASGSKHQREYGHGHASPDRSVETSNDQNQISQTQVHGTRGRRRRWHDRFRLRFRLVSSVPADSDGKSGAPTRRYRTNSPLTTRHYFLASPTMWGSSGRMILVMASSTAAREPGMTRIGTLPISPPTARLRMQAGPIWA